MRKGYLSEYFVGVAAKYLSAVEAHPERSRQHEFNGVQGLKAVLGECTPRRRYRAKFLYLNDDSEPVVSENPDDFVTWYDGREKHPTRSECRLYFPKTVVSEQMVEGDLLVVGKRPNDDVLVLICEAGSTIANQVRWLFGLWDLAHPGFSVKGEIESDQVRLEFASSLILEQIGIEVEDKDESRLDEMLSLFGRAFPATKEFSKYARDAVIGVDPRDDPDGALVAWLSREEVLFRTLEKELVGDRLTAGFADVDDFMTFSLSVQNRRKSRAGSALQNHLSEVFTAHGVRFDSQFATEHRSKPDFLFPGGTAYRDSTFPVSSLTMLGAKTTCKDRWRQVLSEAKRLTERHLCTLEPGISEHQTAEMRASHLQLVLPESLHDTYTANQRAWLMNVGDFVRLVLSRQR